MWTGMLDNGANIMCTNIETAYALNRPIKNHNKPTKIIFEEDVSIGRKSREEKIHTVKDLIDGLTIIYSEANGCEDLEYRVNASRRDRRIPKESVLEVLWLHRCMNHLSPQVMANAIRHGSWRGVPEKVTPILVETIFDKLDCPACELAKRHKVPIPLGSGVKCMIPGHSLSVDYKGPINPVAYGGFKDLSLIHI